MPIFYVFQYPSLDLVLNRLYYSPQATTPASRSNCTLQATTPAERTQQSEDSESRRPILLGPCVLRAWARERMSRGLLATVLLCWFFQYSTLAGPTVAYRLLRQPEKHR